MRAFVRAIALVVVLVADGALAVDVDGGSPGVGGEEGEVNLLDAAPAPEVGPLDVAAKTFGEALSLLNLEATWSGYGDTQLAFVPDKAPSFLMTHFNPIISARMGEYVRAELEMEFEPDKFLAEYAILDFTVHRALTVRVGHFLLPIGQFNEALHPSFAWNMVTRPRMLRTVSPTVVTSTGLQLRGVVLLTPGSTFDYAVYVVNGLGGPADYATKAEVGRNLRRNSLEDNNHDKAFGARVGVKLFADKKVGSTTLGASVYTGAIDPRGAERFSLVHLDLSVKLGPLLIRGEAVQSFLGAEGSGIFTPFESGAWVQATATVWKLDLSARFDWAREKPFALEAINKRTVAANVGFRAFTYWSVRGEVLVPFNDGSTDHRPTISLMLAFSF